MATTRTTKPTKPTPRVRPDRGPFILELNAPLATIPGHIIRDGKYPHRPIASLWEGGGSHGKPKQIANAYLLTAAPVLLQALIRARRQLRIEEAFLRAQVGAATADKVGRLLKELDKAIRLARRGK